MKNIAVVGGDMRNRILVELLRDGGDNVFSFALGDEENGDFLSVINRCDYVITSTPFSKDGEVYIYFFSIFLGAFCRKGTSV